MSTKKQKKRSCKNTFTKKIKRKYNFTEKDYNSNDGMMTSIWGPSTWHLLHSISFNYPISPTKKDKKYYKNFILSLKNILPCGKCRSNLAKNFEKLPLHHYHMESRDTFSKYVFHLHEVVNTMLHKKSGLTYEKVKNSYEQFRARCIKKTDETIMDEKGCIIPYYGVKNKCVLQIVPVNKQCKTFI